MFLLGPYVKPLERNLQLTRGARAEVSAWWRVLCHFIYQLLAAPVTAVGCSSVVLP